MKTFFTIATLLVAQLASVSHAFAPLSQGSATTTTQLSMSSVTEGNGGGVVVTGAAGGVGFAYAGEFMDRGYDVVICDVKDCSVAAKALTAKHPNGRVFHTKCDVSDKKSVESLGKFAQDKLGNIGYWINNAGINGGRRSLMEVSLDTVELVVKVNLLGVLLGTKVAMGIMKDQVGKLRSL
jgi:chlorophyll(ide) b reductase